MQVRTCSDISFLDAGRSEQILLCLHGIQGSKESYKSLLNSSLSQQVRLIIPDIPGFGASKAPADGDFNLERQAARLAEFIRALDFDKLALYGHSLGGMLVTLLLSEIPERISGVISSEGNLRLEDCGESRRVALMTFDDFKVTRYPELQKQGIKVDAWAFYATSKSVVEISTSEKLLKILSESTHPVLFIRGGASHFATTPIGEKIRSIQIPNATHFTLVDTTGSIEAVSDFLLEINS